jgi:hypothetical protein
MFMSESPPVGDVAASSLEGRARDQADDRVGAGACERGAALSEPKKQSSKRSANRREAIRAAGGTFICSELGPEAAGSLILLRVKRGLRQSVEEALIALAKSQGLTD